MPAVNSTMIDLGSKLPEFELYACDENKQYSNENVIGQDGLVVMFVSNHCPYVKHIHTSLTSLYNDYKNSELGFVAISSNDVVNYPDDSPKEMKNLWENLNLDFHVLYDEDQKIARQFDAQCTPEFYLYNGKGELVYRGRLDDSTPGNGIKSSGADLREAIDRLLNNENISENQYPSIGCSIKWK